MSGAPNVGDVLAGKYRVERVLGQGGMGVVVQALHLQLDERVAVKFLLPDYAEHPDASARFLREARAAVKIKSEHVARVIDVGTLETGAPYMVMEFLEGRDLSQTLDAHGALPVEQAVDYILQACEAIAEAHAAGIVHRDLKPANLFVTKRADTSSIIKVLDFGISKVTSPTASGPDLSLTKTSALMGSPLYMSPEQMRSSRDVDARSDIWSLGAILFELLTGKTPFDGDSLPQVCTRILQDNPRSVRELRPELPAELERAVLKALEKYPPRRYQTVAEFAVALLPFGSKGARTSVERISRVIGASGLSKSQQALEYGATQLTPVSATVPSTVRATVSAWGRAGETQAPRRSTWPLVAGAGLLVLVAASAGFLMLKPSSAATAPSTLAGVEPSPTSPSPAPAAAPSSKPTATVLPAPASVQAPEATVAPSAPLQPKAAPIAPRPISRHAARRTSKKPTGDAPSNEPKSTQSGTSAFGDRK